MSAVDEREASEIGLAWAKDWRVRLSAEGRSLTGGWPGTLSEARAATQARALRLHPRTALSPEEAEFVARGAYAIAKRQWLAWASAGDA